MLPKLVSEVKKIGNGTFETCQHCHCTKVTDETGHLSSGDESAHHCTRESS